MALRIGIPAETYPGERRVAMTPRTMDLLAKQGVEFMVQGGAGEAAGFGDNEYAERGARLAGRSDVFGCDLVLQVRTLGSNREEGRADLPLLVQGQTVIGFGDPLNSAEYYAAYAERGVTTFAMELIPRITRAQSMDALSSMATITGYKAALLAAGALPRIFPMLMTAAGTVAAARVFVLGAGVAGLQAIATARRLGGVVSAYDVRAAVKEQVESLGAKFVHFELETERAEDKGGYAKALGEDFYRRQRELLTEVLRHNEVVITTAAVPGKRAPVLITREMVAGMRPGSVIVDLGAEQGGNCEATRPGETVVESGVAIIGPVNLASSIPHDASQMYARNLAALVKHLVKDGALRLDLEDEITRETMVTHGGRIVNARVAPPEQGRVPEAAPSERS
jgi:NAD(P) transhydrogenase subunit alpha